MQKNNVPLKVAIGYTATAIVLIMAMVLVYSNTKSIYDINQASREYIQKQDVADSTMTRLLKEEQNNLKQLSELWQVSQAKAICTPRWTVSARARTPLW